MAMPQVAIAFPRDDGVEQLPEGDFRIRGRIHPILDATIYSNPSPAVETGAFAFVDDAGRLFDININFSTRRYSVVDASGFLGVGTLDSEQHDILRAFARDSSLPPGEQRMQCAGPTSLICALLVAAIVYAVETIRDNRDGDDACAQQIYRDRRFAVRDAVQTCRDGSYTNSSGQRCIETPRYSAETVASLSNCTGMMFLGCQERCSN